MSQLFIGGSTSLVNDIDQIVLVILVDGRHLIGRLRSFDWHGSLVLEDAKERFFAKDKFADVSIGYNLLRGDAVLAICRFDSKNNAIGLQEVTIDELAQYEEEFEREVADIKARIENGEKSLQVPLSAKELWETYRKKE